MSEAARSEGERHDLVAPQVPAQLDADAAEPARDDAGLKLLPYFPTWEEPLRARREERPFRV